MGLNYNSLSRDELIRLVDFDQCAQRFVAMNAAELLSDDQESYSAGYEEGRDDGYDSGNVAGRAGLRKALKNLYAEDLREWLGRIENMALAGDGNLTDLEILLSALHAELNDE